MTIQRLTLRALLALTILPLGLAAYAQSADANPADCSKLSSHAERDSCAETHSHIKTIYLTNVASQNEANEIMVAIRNTVDPSVHVFLLPSQNAIVVSTYPEELAKIEALVHELDRPHKTYRLTYTITELDAGKPIGTEHLSMVVVAGQHTSVKQGDKVPVATGSYSTGEAASATGPGVQTQFTYLDVGMNFDSTLTDYDNGALLKTKVEQSSLGQPSTIAGVQEPVVRQTVLEGIAFLSLGKPVMLGSIDVPNSTRHIDIAVVMDLVK
jgi:type II secretory pathway component GspD/PulD (secretin)